MRSMDRHAIDVCDIPSAELMLRAAKGVSEAAEVYLRKCGGSRILILCGSGNNGGDGIGAAYYLYQAGLQPECIMAGSRDKMTEDSREMERLLLTAGGTLSDFEEGAFTQMLSQADLVIDALFGTGLSRDISGKYREIIEAVNSANAHVISCDMPSGISADIGSVLGCAVRADETITFNLPKTGQMLYPGSDYVGKLIIRDIGIPDESKAAAVFDGDFVTADMVSAALPIFSRLSHKGDHGKVLLYCGSVGYTGAVALSARAALRTGSGLVYLQVPKSIYPILASKLDEPVIRPCSDNDLGQFSLTENEILGQMRDRNAILAGCGIGIGTEPAALVRTILSTASCPVVLDADGLNALREDPSFLRSALCPVIITPHEGEFLRLGGDLSLGRIEAAKDFAAKQNVIVVLKGYRTVVASPEGDVFVNSTGNSGMAVGGSGDVLSGMIVSLLGQGLDPLTAAWCAVFLHGMAGDIAAEKYGMRSMLPTDMISCISEAYKRLDLIK